jgi:predicted amidophosphoribosyltransferase
VLELLLPSRCPACRRVDTDRAGPCAGCLPDLPPPPVLPAPAGVDRCLAVCSYDRVGAAVVAALKFRGERAVARWAAAVLAPSVLAAGVDVVTWVPTSGPRRRRRGLDQAEVLARAVARATGLPVRRLLRREAGPAQEGRTAAERRDGPNLRTIGAVATRVLVVDDVVTTGASVSAAARVLRARGAVRVVAACLARTPRNRYATWR